MIISDLKYRLLKLRVVHVTPSLNMEHPSGIDVHVHELTSSLSKKGISVAVYTSGKKERNHVSGIEVHRFPIYTTSETPFFARNIDFFQTLVKRSWFPIHTFTFFKELNQESDIIHIHGHEYPVSFLAMLAAKKAGIPTILTIHGVERGLETLKSFRLIRKFARPTFFNFMINNANAVIAPSDQVLQVLKKYNPRFIAKIPHGISLERFQGVKKNPKYVLYLGRLFPVKGPNIFIKAASLLLKKIDTEFLVVGYGSQRTQLERLVKRLGISNKVKFLGEIPYNQVPNILAEASVFVSPGVSGYTLLEAASAGVPIVSGRIGWNVSCVGEDSAIYVNPTDVKEMANAVEKLLTDHKFAEALAKRAKGFVENNRSWDSIIHRYIRIYESVLESN